MWLFVLGCIIFLIVFGYIRSSTGSAPVAGGNVFPCHSADAWRSKLEEAKEDKRLVVVDFTATWCGPCKLMAPFFAELSLRYPNVLFLKVDVDELKDVAVEYDVQAMPTFMFLKDGVPIDRLIGARKDELEKRVGSLSKK